VVFCAFPTYKMKSFAILGLGLTVTNLLWVRVLGFEKKFIFIDSRQYLSNPSPTFIAIFAFT